MGPSDAPQGSPLRAQGRSTASHGGLHTYRPVLNRADPVGSDNQDARDILSEVAGMEFSGLTIVNRKAFGKAVSVGLSVVELSNPDDKATREIVALYEYLFRAKIEY